MDELHRPKSKAEKNKAHELINKLSDPEDKVRAEAARQLNWIVVTQAFDVLVQALLFDKSKSVRMYAAGALGKLKDKRAIEPLAKALDDIEDIVRHWAAHALGHIGNGQAYQPLVKALKDPEAKVRWVAAEALGDIGDGRAIEPLQNSCKDENNKVRENAKIALETIKHKMKK